MLYMADKERGGLEVTDTYDFSIVIPTWNRSGLVDELLKTLYKARANYHYGNTEVLIVDSSEGVEETGIRQSCQKYGGTYIKGPDSVRRKRNIGIEIAKYAYVLFIDSDVRVDRDIINRHAQTWLHASPEENLGGTFGVTEFVGSENFVWKVVSYSTFVNSFSFAKWFPYQNWTIGNNVSFKKSVLEEVNLFEEAFPFKLGGDDLDLSYRITKAGYRIKSVPDALTWHSKETWSHFKSINDRTRRWGSMEYFLSRRHPEIFITSGLKTELIWGILFPLALILSACTRDISFILGDLIFMLVSFLLIYAMDALRSGKRNIIFYGFAKWFEARYYFFHVLEGIKHGTLDGTHKTMSFSFQQTRAMMIRESYKDWLLVLSLVIGCTFFLMF